MFVVVETVSLVWLSLVGLIWLALCIPGLRVGAKVIVRGWGEMFELFALFSCLGLGLILTRTAALAPQLWLFTLVTLMTHPRSS